MMSFNNSIPHEVINPSQHPRLVLLFDALLPDIHSSDKGRKETMESLHGEWARTVKRVNQLDSAMLNATRKAPKRLKRT